MCIKRSTFHDVLMLSRVKVFCLTESIRPSSVNVYKVNYRTKSRFLPCHLKGLNTKVRVEKQFHFKLFLIVCGKISFLSRCPIHMAPRQEKEFDQTPLNWRQHCKHIALNARKKQFRLFSVAKVIKWLVV